MILEIIEEFRAVLGMHDMPWLITSTVAVMEEWMSLCTLLVWRSNLKLWFIITFRWVSLCWHSLSQDMCSTTIVEPNFRIWFQLPIATQFWQLTCLYHDWAKHAPHKQCICCRALGGPTWIPKCARPRILQNLCFNRNSWDWIGLRVGL